LREIETCDQVRIKIAEVPQVMSELIDGNIVWSDVTAKYPSFKANEADDDKWVMKLFDYIIVKVFVI